MRDDDTIPGRSMEADLVAWGRIISLETRGRRSGLPRRVSVGFIAEQGDDLVVAASDEHTHWAQNLIAEPRCWVELGGARSRRRAERLGDEERGASVNQLILKYGTPAERLGAGPAFRLTLIESDE